MIPADLLVKLRAKDPELWENVQSRVGTTYDSVGNEIELTTDDLSWDAEEAWLLYCIMRAIRARGWHLYQIRNDDLPIQPCIADIFRQDDKNFVMGCGTEAEALLQAYLAALEATE